MFKFFFLFSCICFFCSLIFFAFAFARNRLLNLIFDKHSRVGSVIWILMIVHLVLGAWFLFVAALLTRKTRQEVCYRCYARNIIGRCWQVCVSTSLTFSGCLLHSLLPASSYRDPAGLSRRPQIWDLTVQDRSRAQPCPQICSNIFILDLAVQEPLGIRSNLFNMDHIWLASVQFKYTGKLYCFLLQLQ